MVELKILNEPEIINNVLIRLKENVSMFTYAGQTLIAMNAYKYFENLFDDD